MFFRQPKIQKLLFWKTLGRICFLLGILSIPQAVAAPLNQYCISQVGQKPKPQFDKTQERPEPITIFVRGEQFKIDVHVSWLMLKRQEDSSVVSEVNAEQEEDGGILDIALTKDGWVWIEGYETDYVVKLNLQNTPPTLGEPVKMPRLYSKPCSFFTFFTKGCGFVTGGTYSPTLNRVFISGYRGTFLGKSTFVSYEIVAGEAKLLPEEAQGGDLISEFPKLNGVLLSGASGDPLFYDGVKITKLPLRESILGKDNVEPSSNLEKTKSGRTFFTNAGLLDNLTYLTRLTQAGRSPAPLFLMELEDDLKLKPISIPDELADRGLTLIQLTKDTPMFGITQKGIYLEVEDSLKIVATASDKWFIFIPPGIKQSPDGSLYFVLTNLTTDTKIDYFLIPSSSTSQCQATLNPDKPILLGDK
jgi:hypothetical protein